MFDLTDEELAVLEQLGTAASAFFKLPRLHPSDTDEFVRAVHAAQNIILARPGMRQYQVRRGFTYGEVRQDEESRK